MSNLKARQQLLEPRLRNGSVRRHCMEDSKEETRWRNKVFHEGEIWHTDRCCQGAWRIKILTYPVILKAGEEVFQKEWQQSRHDVEERGKRNGRHSDHIKLVERNNESAKNEDREELIDVFMYSEESEEIKGERTMIEVLENEIKKVREEELSPELCRAASEIQVDVLENEKCDKSRSAMQLKTRFPSPLELRHGIVKNLSCRRPPKRDDSLPSRCNRSSTMTASVSRLVFPNWWETKTLYFVSLHGTLCSPLIRSLLSELFSMLLPRADLRLAAIQKCSEVSLKYQAKGEWLHLLRLSKTQPSRKKHDQQNLIKVVTTTLTTLRETSTRTSHFSATGPHLPTSPFCRNATTLQLPVEPSSVTLASTHRVMSESRPPSQLSLAPPPHMSTPSPWQQRTPSRYRKKPSLVTLGNGEPMSFCPMEYFLPPEDRDPTRRSKTSPCARPWHLTSRLCNIGRLLFGTATDRRRKGGCCTYRGLLVLLLVSLLVTELGAQDAIIRTRQGPVQAVMRVSNKRNIYAFLGIPYAKPPINELRFKRPQRHEGWRETLKASEEGVACPQPFLRGIRMDEDCLTLNIWIPEMPLGYRRTPVVVLLEGEMFLTSKPSRFPGEDLAAADVIVVTINYRTNAFGFLSTQNAEMAGNMGLWDQHLALSWVMENIELFGGDITRVTLLGHSAGAASSSYHLVSSQSQGLFSRLILMSGSFMAPWALSRYPRRAATRLAELLECGYTSYSRYLLECLQKQDVNRVVKAVENLIELGDPDLLFGPVVDDFLRPEQQFVPRVPEAALARAGSRRIPIVAGLSEDEGSVMLFLKREINYMPYDDLARYGREVLVPMVTRMAHLGPGHSLVINQIVSFEYLDLAVRKDRDSLVRQIVNMFSDGLFKASTLRMARALSENGMAPFLFINKFSSVDIYESPSNISGALHGAELVYLFGPTAYRRLFYRTFNYNEERLSDSLKQLVYSLASTGEPTLRSYAPRWNPYTQQEPTYAILESGQVYTDYDRHQMAFWNELLPTLANMVHIIPPIPTRTVSPEGTPITDSQIVTGQQVVPYKSAVWVLVAILLALLILIVVYVVCARRRQKHSTSTLHEQ